MTKIKKIKIKIKINHPEIKEQLKMWATAYTGERVEADTLHLGSSPAIKITTVHKNAMRQRNSEKPAFFPFIVPTVFVQ